MDEKKFDEPVMPPSYAPTEEQLRAYIEHIRIAYNLEEKKPKSILDKLRSLYANCFKKED